MNRVEKSRKTTFGRQICYATNYQEVADISRIILEKVKFFFKKAILGRFLLTLGENAEYQLFYRKLIGDKKVGKFAFLSDKEHSLGRVYCILEDD